MIVFVKYCGSSGSPLCSSWATCCCCGSLGHVLLLWLFGPRVVSVARRATCCCCGSLGHMLLWCCVGVTDVLNMFVCVKHWFDVVAQFWVVLHLDLLVDCAWLNGTALESTCCDTHHASTVPLSRSACLRRHHDHDWSLCSDLWLIMFSTWGFKWVAFGSLVWTLFDVCETRLHRHNINNQGFCV